VALSDEDENGDLTGDISDHEIDEIDFAECSVHQICPHGNSVLKYRMFDVDGTNLEECAVCLKCGYGSPALR
jgi:hypothetical protein